MDDCRIRNLSSETIRWMQYRLELIFARLKDDPIVSLSLAQVKAAVAALMEGRTASTVNGYMRASKAVLNCAIDNDHEVGVNPRRLKKIREPKRLPPCFTKDQAEALLRQPDKSAFLGLRDYTMMCLMLDVGLRLGEMTGLPATDIGPPYLKVYGMGEKTRGYRQCRTRW